MKNKTNLTTKFGFITLLMSLLLSFTIPPLTFIFLIFLFPASLIIIALGLLLEGGGKSRKTLENHKLSLPLKIIKLFFFSSLVLIVISITAVIVRDLS